MATITLKELTNLQARVIFQELEDNWSNFNRLLENEEIERIDLDDSNVHTDDEGDTHYSLTFCEEEKDVEDEEDGPGYEPEDCECKEEMEKSGIEYTKDFTPSTDKTFWICDHCGRPN